MQYRDAGRATMDNVLRSNRSVFICTGSEAESLATATGEDKVVLEGRYGFVRLALSWGCPLVPVYGVGVTDLYTTYSFAASTRRWLSKTAHIALPLFTGRWWSPIPHKVPVKVLVGKPIEVPTPKVKGLVQGWSGESKRRGDPKVPSEALVKEFHEKYVKALTELYDAHSGKKGQLQIIPS